MKPTAIHQFSISCHYGDGITNGMLFTRRLLRKAGISSEIFCIEIDPALAEDVFSYDAYTGSSQQVLLIHHGIGNSAEDWLRQLPDKKVMVFHNITPSDFFPPDDPIQPLLAQGWQQLESWQGWLDGAIADSDTNREILIQHGYDSNRCKTIPLLVDLDKIQSSPSTPSPRPVEDIFHLLFVGRLFIHKNQLGLVRALAYLRQMTGLNIHLTLVGAGDNSYRGLLEKSCSELGLSSVVHMAGRVSDSELSEYFSKSDLYVSLSRHEGFGMPLVEALAHCLPVAAFDCPGSNVAKTLGTAGIITDTDDPATFAAIVSRLIEQPLLRRELVKNGVVELKRYRADKLYRELSDFFTSIDIELPENSVEPRTERVSDFRIEGPFDSSYSLAIVNRNLALALAASDSSVALNATEGNGDYTPSKVFLRQNPALLDLYNNSENFDAAKTVLRLMYPTRLTGMNGINHALSCYGWEESTMPKSTIDHINYHAHFVTTMSEYVTRTLIDNGANVPIFTTGIGANHILEHEADGSALPDIAPGFRILHISSCFPRKGIDILLDAYAEHFKSSDDVSLVIKTFPNPHHDIDKLIRSWRKKHPAAGKVQLINRDLDGSAIRALYEQCHVLVAPSKGEGFGLPMAEAMLHKLPVVTTGFGGQHDFCNKDTAWTIDYRFTYADTHMGLFDSIWAEPEQAHLGEILSQLHLAYSSGGWEGAIREKTELAFQRVSDRYSWDAVATGYRDALSAIERLPAMRNAPKLGCISTWNSKCGIATYSKLLISPALANTRVFANSDAQLVDNDGENILRCWKSGHNDDLEHLYSAILEASLDQVLIQFNFSFFDLKAFKRLLNRLRSSNIDVFITFHSTADVIQGHHTKSLKQLLPELQHVARVFVHSVSDLNNLKDFGIVTNACLFPHGVSTNISGSLDATALEELSGKTIISSYGFLLPHKGIRNLIRGFGRIAEKFPNTHLLLVNAEYPADISIQETILCRRLIQELSLSARVTLISDFLEDSESLAWLSLSSHIVFPYENTQESSSAAVRWGLSSGKPVYCTPLPIFDDVREVVGFFSGTGEQDIEDGLISMLTGPVDSGTDLGTRQQEWLKDHDWVSLSRRLGNLLQSHAINKTLTSA